MLNSLDLFPTHAPIGISGLHIVTVPASICQPHCLICSIDREAGPFLPFPSPHTPRFAPFILQIPFHPLKPARVLKESPTTKLCCWFSFSPGHWINSPSDLKRHFMCLHGDQRIQSLSFASQCTKSTPDQQHTVCSFRLPLLDFQDGWVGFHDGHNDPVNVVLQAEVNLLLLLNCLHELVSGDRADFCSQGLGEGS